MNRLFFRLYAILIAALVLTSVGTTLAILFARWQSDIDTAERSLAGGARLAAEYIAQVAERSHPDALRELSERFETEVSLHRIDDPALRDELQRRLRRGDVVLHGENMNCLSARVNSDLRLQMGPFEDYAFPAWELMLVMVLGVGFGGVALVGPFRRLHRELYDVESTMNAFASGTREARVDLRRVRDLRDLGRTLNDTMAAAGDALRAHEELLQAVSHELRTPLARLRFRAALIAAEDAGASARAADLDQDIDELDDLVQELLDYVRVGASSPNETVELHALVRSVVERCAHAQLDATRPVPSVRMSRRLSLERFYVRGNANELRRALMNLVTNAQRFAKNRVLIDAQQEGNRLTIWVDDDGPGMEASLRKTASEPFVRGEDSPGSGLGLAIAERIARKHDGTLEIGKAEIGGCRVQLHFPSTSLSR